MNENSKRKKTTYSELYKEKMTEIFVSGNHFQLYADVVSHTVKVVTALMLEKAKTDF